MSKPVAETTSAGCPFFCGFSPHFGEASRLWTQSSTVWQKQRQFRSGLKGCGVPSQELQNVNADGTDHADLRSRIDSLRTPSCRTGGFPGCVPGGSMANPGKRATQCINNRVLQLRAVCAVKLPSHGSAHDQSGNETQTRPSWISTS